MSAIVICAFPGCGKSVYYSLNSIYEGHKNGKKILDSDSSLFSWIYDNDGNKTSKRNPEFPGNYIQHIKNNLNSQDIIFVSSHILVRKALRENKRVIYQATAVFRGNELMARGVNLQAVSTDGTLDFNVYLYNIQPGYQFNYNNGRAKVDRQMQVNEE